MLKTTCSVLNADGRIAIAYDCRKHLCVVSVRRCSHKSKQVVGKFCEMIRPVITDTKVRNAELIYSYDWSSVPQANFSTIPSFCSSVFFFILASHTYPYVTECFVVVVFFLLLIHFILDAVYVFVIGMERRTKYRFCMFIRFAASLSYSTAMKGTPLEVSHYLFILFFVLAGSLPIYVYVNTVNHSFIQHHFALVRFVRFGRFGRSRALLSSSSVC